MQLKAFLREQEKQDRLEADRQQKVISAVEMVEQIREIDADVIEQINQLQD